MFHIPVHNTYVMNNPLGGIQQIRGQNFAIF